VPGSEREKLTSALKRIAPQAVELSSPDWWLHSQFMVCIMLVDGPWKNNMNESVGVTDWIIITGPLNRPV